MILINNIINKNTFAQKFTVDFKKVKADEKEKIQTENKKEEKQS